MAYQLVSRVGSIILFSVALVLASVAPLQGDEEIASRVVDKSMDSGPVQNSGTSPGIVFSSVIQINEAEWIRLTFDEVTLGGDRALGTGSYLVITSLLDNQFQVLDHASLWQWQNTSAYFNGNAVRLDLIAHPNTGNNRVVIRQIIASDTSAEERTICGPTDDRVLSSDPRTGRIVPVGCTAWFINDELHCLLTAGHCAGNSMQVLEFNVPLSNSNGTLVHPGPQDQYIVDQSSVQFTNGGLGNDWNYFGCFPNATTGLTAYQAQGDFFTIANPPAASGQPLRVTGYGTVSSPVSPTWNQVQKTHVGPYSSLSGTIMRYMTDTTGGNSGSPIIDENTGIAYGIHTNAGCTSGGGTNSGTAVSNGGLQNALAHPLGVCENDPTPPYPDPMSFSIAPTASSATSISMQATEASDSISPPVQYFFDFVGGSPEGSDSGWQTSRDYENTGLAANSFYNYVVRARDSNLPSPNVTSNSSIVTAATAIETPTGISIGEATNDTIVVNADGTFTNLGLGSTGFYFEMTPAIGNGANAWTANTSINIDSLTPCTQYTLRVKARNFQGDETAWVGPVVVYTPGCTGCLLTGDMNGSGMVEGGDIAGYVRTKMGYPAGNDYSMCADYGTGTIEGDTDLFVADLLTK